MFILGLSGQQSYLLHVCLPMNRSPGGHQVQCCSGLDVDDQNRPKDIWTANFIFQCGYVHFVVGNVHLGRSSMFTTNLSYICSRILSYITSYMLIETDERSPLIFGKTNK
jgi:hypothetical protein